MRDARGRVQMPLVLTGAGLVLSSSGGDLFAAATGGRDAESGRAPAVASEINPGGGFEVNPVGAWGFARGLNARTAIAPARGDRGGARWVRVRTSCACATRWGG